MSIRTWFPSRNFRLLIASVVLFDVVGWAGYARDHVPWLGLCCIVPRELGGGRHPRRIHAYALLQADGQMVIVDYYSDRGQALFTNGPASGETLLAEVHSFPRSSTQGLAAPALETVKHTLGITPASRPLTLAEVKQLRVSITTASTQDWEWSNYLTPTTAGLMSAGDGTTTLIHWGWLLHDLCILALLIAVGVSYYLGSIAPWREKRRLERAVIALGAFRCPSCGYSIAGMTQGEGHRCPECGRELVP